MKPRCGRLPIRPPRWSCSSRGPTAWPSSKPHAPAEIRGQGLINQQLVINAVFRATDRQDALATAFERRGAQAITKMPPELSALPRSDIPLRGRNIVGLGALRSFLSAAPEILPPEATAAVALPPGLMDLQVLVDDLAATEHGLVMVMGKGGVGKTTIAAAVAASQVVKIISCEIEPS
jgi:arsenite-transporting ATPase